VNISFELLRETFVENPVEAVENRWENSVYKKDAKGRRERNIHDGMNKGCQNE
jgi:hypothetical protein